MQTRHGTMATERPARYAKQLAGHWARKGSCRRGGRRHRHPVRDGTGRADVAGCRRRLRVEASVPDGGDPDRFAQVVKDHLERFGQREELDVVWDDAGASGDDRDGLRTLPPGFLLGVASAGHQNEGNNSNSDTWFVETRVADGVQGAVRHGVRRANRWREDVGLAANSLGLDGVPLLRRVGPRRARGGHLRRGGDRPLRGHHRRGDRARHGTGRHLQPLHQPALVRGRGQLARRRRAPAVRPVLPTGRWSGSATGSPTPSRSTSPTSPPLLSWLGLPDFIRDLDRATLDRGLRGGRGPGVPDLQRVLPEEHRGHRGRHRRRAHRRPRRRSRSAARPARRSLDRRDGRRRRRRRPVGAATASGPSATSAGSLLASDDDFLGVQNYERVPLRRSRPWCTRPRAPRSTRWAPCRPTPCRSPTAVPLLPLRSPGVPVLVTEHGMAHGRRPPARGVHRAGPPRPARRHRGRRPVLGYSHWTPMDNFEWIFGYGAQARAARGRPRDPGADAQAERRGVRRDREGARRRPRVSPVYLLTDPSSASR